MSLDDPDLQRICDEYRDDDSCPDHDYHAYAEWLIQSKSKRTVITYLRYLSQWTQEPTKEALEQFRQWAEQEARRRFDERSKQVRFMYMVRTAVSHYVGDELAEHLPDVGDEPGQIEMPTSQVETKARLTEEQIEQIIRRADDQQFALAVAIAFYGNLRFFALTHLTPEWLSFNADDPITVTVPSRFAKGREKKNPEPEIAYIPRAFEDSIKEYIKDLYGYDGDYADLYEELARDDRPGDFLTLFNFKGKEPVTGERGVKEIERERYEFVKQLRQAAKQIGANNWADLGSHTPRKSMVFDLYEKTGDINQTAEIVRHQDVETTKRYLGLEEQEKMATFKANYG